MFYILYFYKFTVLQYRVPRDQTSIQTANSNSQVRISGHMIHECKTCTMVFFMKTLQQHATHVHFHSTPPTQYRTIDAVLLPNHRH